MEKHSFFSIRTLLHYAKDVFALLFIFAIGWFLIGYYTHFEFLQASYQDWMSHAFRIESLQQNGFLSWDYVWSDGINYWRSYQYIPHVFVLGLSQLFHLTIPKAMIFTVVGIFIYIRLSTYIFLRYLKVPALIALFVTVASFTYAQQWTAISDFTLFFSLAFVPIFVFLWILALKHRRYMYLISALAGALWMVHPILGYSMTGLWAFVLFFSSPKLKPRQFVTSLIIFGLSWSSFVMPYFFYGYKYTNPLFSFPQFLTYTITDGKFGLSMMYGILFVFSWVITFLQTGKVERWSKLLLLYVTLYFGVILIGLHGYLPSFLVSLQFSRGIAVIGVILPFVFAKVIVTVAHYVESRFFLGLMAIILALCIAEASDVATQYSAPVAQKIDDPVQKFATTHDHDGAYYIDNVTQATYFSYSNNIRFITSYYEQIEPHPLSQRFRKLVRSDLAYRGVSLQQALLIGAYSRVMGLEYLFLPEFSPLPQYLMQKQDGQSQEPFADAGKVGTDTGTFQVLKNTAPIHYAYLADTDVIQKNVSFADLPQPTLQADSNQPWDKEMQRFDAFLQSKDVTPLPMNFLARNKLDMVLPTNISLEHKAVIIVQSFDNNWHFQSHADVKISPTSLRFMYFPVSDNLANQTLVLENTWPNWYWPVQSLAVVGIVIAVLLEIVEVYV